MKKLLFAFLAVSMFNVSCDKEKAIDTIEDLTSDKRNELEYKGEVYIVSNLASSSSFQDDSTGLYFNELQVNSFSTEPGAKTAKIFAECVNQTEGAYQAGTYTVNASGDAIVNTISGQIIFYVDNNEVDRFTMKSGTFVIVNTETKTEVELIVQDEDGNECLGGIYL